MLVHASSSMGTIPVRRISRESDSRPAACLSRSLCLAEAERAASTGTISEGARARKSAGARRRSSAFRACVRPCSMYASSTCTPEHRPDASSDTLHCWMARLRPAASAAAALDGSHVKAQRSSCASTTRDASSADDCAHKLCSASRTDAPADSEPSTTTVSVASTAVNRLCAVLPAVSSVTLGPICTAADTGAPARRSTSDGS